MECCKHHYCGDHWRRKWRPTPVSLPGKFHGLRSLVACSPWGCKESCTTELLILIVTFLVLLQFLSYCSLVYKITLLSPCSKRIHIYCEIFSKDEDENQTHSSFYYPEINTVLVHFIIYA